jgi:hypothetical protein
MFVVLWKYQETLSVEYMNYIPPIATQLQEILPAELQHEIPALTKVLDELLTGKTDQFTAQKNLSSIPHVKEITRLLYEKNINLYGSQLSFGEMNQFDSVSIGDIAGGNIYKLDVVFASSQKEVSRFSLLIKGASDKLTGNVSKKEVSFLPVIILGTLSIVLTFIPFIPSWIPAAGIIVASTSQWLLIEGQKRIAWMIWWIGLGIIILLREPVKTKYPRRW